MNYIFPATKWANKNHPIDAQWNKIAEEFEEARIAPGFYCEEALIECLDMIQAIETYLRIAEIHGCNIDEAYQKVIQKNEARGYYKQEDKPCSTK
jgi:hypothetical protein